MANNVFGERLKELRDKAGLTQEQLAAKLGIHQTAIARWELGRVKTSWDSVQALAAALGVDCTAFAEAPEPPAKPKKKNKGK